MALDYREQIVEIVSDAAREPADRFHFLGLAQLFFEGVAFADVLGDNQPHRTAVVIETVRDRFHFENPAVFLAMFKNAVILVQRVPFLAATCEWRRALPGADVENGQVRELFRGVAILVHGGIVHLHKFQRVGFEDPGRDGIVSEQ